MIALNTQRKLREVSQLSFCYLCGQSFNKGDITNRDHIPPAALFDKLDRNVPLTLRAHRHCNASQGPVDERMVQLLGLKLGRVPRQQNQRLNLKLGSVGNDGPELGTVEDLDIRGAVQRWVRGFHAALYKLPMPIDAQFAIQTPFPSGRIESGKIVVDELPKQHFLFVSVIKRNRVIGALDTISCNNGKLKYECVWDQADDAKHWLCIFALDLYSWIDLGDINNFVPRGCAGMYRSLSGPLPKDATKATRLDFQFANAMKSDPFGD
jgi:hypothetical protein